MDLSFRDLVTSYVNVTVNLYITVINANVNIISNYYVNNIIKALLTNELNDSDSIPMFADYRTHAKTDQTLEIIAHMLTPSQNERLTVNSKNWFWSNQNNMTIDNLSSNLTSPSVRFYDKRALSCVHKSTV